MGRLVEAAFNAGFAVGSTLTAAAAYLVFQLMFKRTGNKRDSFETAVSKASTSRSMMASSEQVNFLTDIVNRLWVKLSPAIGETVKTAVEPTLAESLPGPLASMHFTKCDFGQVPFRFDNILVHPLDDGMIKFDMDVVWDGACNIKLQAGRIHLGVKNIKLFGRLQFIMSPLIDLLPCIGAIQYGFINPPTLELDFTGLANLADIGGVDKKIRTILDDVIAGVMVLPNRMTYRMDLACDYRDAFAAPLGIARLTAVSGRGFKVEKTKFKTDIPDVYLRVKLGSSPEWKTSVQKNTLSPAWNESADFLLSDTDQIVEIQAWDEDKGVLDADDELGVAYTTVGDILTARGKTLEVELLNEENIGTGAFITLHCDVCSLVKPTTFETSPPSNHLAGLLTIMVTKAFDLPVSKEEAQSFVKVKFGGQEFVTSVIYDYPGYVDGQNPTYDISFLVPITREHMESGTLPNVQFELLNGATNPTTLGSLSIPAQSLLEAPDGVITESRVIGAGPTKLQFYLSLMGVDDTNVSSPVAVPTGQPSSAPIVSDNEGGGEVTASQGREEEQKDELEKVKVTILSGKGFQIKKTRKFKKDDIPDVYCCVKFGSSPKVWRTTTIKDEVAPEWGESEIYNLTNKNQVISLDAFDANKRGDDDYLGSMRVTVAKVLLNAGKLEMELQDDGKPLGQFITIACELL